MNQYCSFWKALGAMTLIFAGTLLPGCASMTDRRRHQYVYIQSEPPGAVIYSDGSLVGSTPSLVRLRRERKKELELQIGAERKRVPLETTYAWNESFVGNLAFFSGAPYGWLTDLAMGTAWNYTDPAPVKFSKSAPVKNDRTRLALAPPLAESYSISDEAAQQLEILLPKLYPQVQLIPYQDSLADFQAAGFDYDERPTDEQRYREILYTLKADQVFFSEVHDRGTTANLQAQLKDHSGNVIEEKSLEAPLASRSSWKNKAMNVVPKWYQFLPNTVGLEFSNTNTYLSHDSIYYPSVESNRKSLFGSAISYLQAITLSRLQIPRPDRQARWRFMFTPGARFSYKTIFFPTFEKLAYVDFDYIQAAAGIGPEVGYQSGRHYSYFRLLPLWAFYQLDWNQPGGSHQSMAVGRLESQSEIGYLYFLNDRVSLKLFIKSTSTSVDLWNSAAQRVNPTTPPLTFSSESYSGIAIGYTFDLRDRLAQ